MNEDRNNDGTGWTDCCFEEQKENDEHLRAMIGDEGRKRHTHTRNDVYQTSVCRTIPSSSII